VRKAITVPERRHLEIHAGLAKSNFNLKTKSLSNVTAGQSRKNKKGPEVAYRAPGLG
jgi:hypothetical protein